MTDQKVFRCLRYGHSLSNLIEQGYPRPTEEQLEKIARCGTDSSVKYLKSLGIPVKFCSYMTARFYPEVLDGLATYTRAWYQGSVDITQDSHVYISHELLSLALNLRPDLHDVVRSYVIQDRYLNLFERLNIEPQDIDIGQIFHDKDLSEIRKWADKWNLPKSAFFPAVLRTSRKDVIDEFLCPELLQMFLDNWDITDEYIQRHLLDKVPKMYVAIHIRNHFAYLEDIGDTSIEKLVEFAQEYQSYFPQMKRFFELYDGQGMRDPQTQYRIRNHFDDLLSWLLEVNDAM